MKAIIIADIHDNLGNLGKCLDYARPAKAGVLLVCGDIAKDATVAFMADKFAGPIHLVRGNMCLFDEQEILSYNNIKYYGATGRFRLDGYWLGLCHEPHKIAAVLAEGRCDRVFYGHTHKPWEETRGGVKISNPGTLNGMYRTSTFAVWDSGSDTIELIMADQV